MEIQKGSDKPQDEIIIGNEVRFSDVDAFWKWANGNEARYPITIHNIGVTPTYPAELVIEDRQALLKDEDNVRWFSQNLKDAVDYIPVSQTP